MCSQYNGYAWCFEFWHCIAPSTFRVAKFVCIYTLLPFFFSDQVVSVYCFYDLF